MTRETLIQVLGKISGLLKKGACFEVPKDHRLTFFIGQPGQAMIIGEVSRCSLDDMFVELQTREKGASFFIPYDVLHAVGHRQPEERAGFA